MKAYILDDEPAAVRRLQQLLTGIDPDVEIVATLSSIETSVEWFDRHPSPDLVLMDIHLADGSSFEIFEKAKVDAPVIFATAYDEYALKAFKVNAIDYLLKPIKEEELRQAMERVSGQAVREDAGEDILSRLLEAGFIKKQRRVLVKMGQSIKLVELDQVAYFYSRDKITFAVMPGKQRYPLDQSLDQVEQMVDPASYFRINRQFLVRLDAIEEMVVYSKSRIKLKLNPPTEEDAIVSKERSPDFRKWLVGAEE